MKNERKEMKKDENKWMKKEEKEIEIEIEIEIEKEKKEKKKKKFNRKDYWHQWLLDLWLWCNHNCPK